MTSTKNGRICDPILKKTMKKNNQKKKKIIHTQKIKIK